MIMCQPMVMMLVLPFQAELTSTIGPGSRKRRMLDTGKSVFQYVPYGSIRRGRAVLGKGGTAKRHKVSVVNVNLGRGPQKFVSRRDSRYSSGESRD